MIGSGVFLIGWMLFCVGVQLIPSVCCNKKKPLVEMKKTHFKSDAPYHCHYLE